MLRAWQKEMSAEVERLAALRERLKGGILSQLDEVTSMVIRYGGCLAT